MEQIDFELLSGMENLIHIHFNKFYYCSFVPLIKMCRPNTDGVSSLKDLLGKPFLRYMLWVVTALTYLGNGLVMWGRYTFRDEKKTLSMVIRNLAVADSLMGVYLTVIGVQDARYRDMYNEVSQSWVTSWTCTAAGVIAMVSSEVSILILTFMSIERFILIADPFGGHRSFTTENIVMALFIIWILGGALAILPVIHWRSSTRFYGSYSGTCFPLHIQESYPLGWQYSAFIFLGVNLLGLLLISSVYTALLLSIWHTRRETPLSVVDCEFAIRFFFIVLTDAGCWLPIIALKILALLQFEISADIYAWLVIFVLPLNSAVNPVLYTFTTPRYRDLLMSRGIRAFPWKNIRWDYLQRRLSGADTDSSRINTPGSSSKIPSLKSDPLKPARKDFKDV